MTSFRPIPSEEVLPSEYINDYLRKHRIPANGDNNLKRLRALLHSTHRYPIRVDLYPLHIRLHLQTLAKKVVPIEISHYALDHILTKVRMYLERLDTMPSFHSKMTAALLLWCCEEERYLPKMPVEWETFEDKNGICYPMSNLHRETKRMNSLTGIPKRLAAAILGVEVSNIVIKILKSVYDFAKMNDIVEIQPEHIEWVTTNSISFVL